MIEALIEAAAEWHLAHERPMRRLWFRVESYCGGWWENCEWV